MSDFLFSSVEARKFRPLPTVNPRCDRCGLYRDCQSPKMKIDGDGRRKFLIIGDYPGAAEDESGHPFSGGSGKWLEAELSLLDFDMRRDAWLTNALICFDTNKRQPATSVEDCRPNLLRAIRELNPIVVILAGSLAVQSLIGHLWKPDPGPISKWTGRQIPVRSPNIWVCPTYNPAFLLREKADPVARLHFRGALAGAVAKTARPWPDDALDYADQVETIHSPTEAAARLKRFVGGTIAFDYETTTAKPQSPHAEIVCCSVCWEGKETIAFPWHGPVIPEMVRILSAPRIRKIASNLKFEALWTKEKLGIDVQGWLFDTMLGAHVLDARRGGGDLQERGSGCTGLKFLSFVRLGVPDYSSHLEDFLKPVGGKESAGGNAVNRIREINLETLMRYCGIDSLLEFLIAQQMMEELGM